VRRIHRGLPLGAAALLRPQHGLVAGNVGTTTSCDVPKGTIASTNPGAGAVVPIGSTVNMTQSIGRPPTPCE
jgi:beta-lactam-binding protein with PASTA domain